MYPVRSYSSAGFSQYPQSGGVHSDDVPAQSIKSVDDARTHLSEQAFPDQVQAYRYLYKIQEREAKGIIDRQCSELIKKALHEHIANLPSLHIKSGEEALEYLQEYYQDIDQLDEAFHTLILSGEGTDGHTTLHHLTNVGPMYRDSLLIESDDESEIISSTLTSADISDNTIEAQLRDPNTGSLRDIVDIYRAIYRTTDVRMENQRILPLMQQLRTGETPPVDKEVMIPALEKARNTVGASANQVAQEFGIKDRVQIALLQEQVLEKALVEMRRNPKLKAPQLAQKYDISDEQDVASLKNESNKLRAKRFMSYLPGVS